jgi:hypothetical protein
VNAQVEEVSGELLDAMPVVRSALPVSTANPYLSLVETMVSRGGDLSSLDKMLDLQIKWEAKEARKAFVAAMAAFKAEPMEILKRKLVAFETRDGDVTSYTHAELADVTDAVVPAMGKHGLSHRWDVQQSAGQITVSCQITHALGHSESVSMTAAPDASGKKNAIQQVASALTYLQRYTLLAATGMAAKGMDDDGRHSAPESTTESAGPSPLQGWIDKIEGAADVTELRAIKAEMVREVGDAQGRVPRTLLDAYNAKVKAVTP